jgi:glycosyltransferase involved in cell wall biosynthesis
MTEKSPLVTVLMPVYNGEKYLNEAIDSILNQSYENLEFLIINDGSTDKTEEIILAYKDERIKYFKNEKNLRLIASLNKGLDLAKGKYIARMDADDIALPLRLEKQIAFMEQHENVGLLGTYYSLFKEQNNDMTPVKMPFTHHEGLKFRLLFSSSIRHPTAVIRTATLRDNSIYFNKDFLHAEEHQFWLEIIKYAQVAVYPEILLNVRLHQESVTENDAAKKIQAKTETQIRMEQINALGVSVSQENELLLCQFLEYFRYTRNPFLERTTYFSKIEMNQLYELVIQIILENRKKVYWDTFILEKMFVGKLSDILLTHTHLGLFTFFFLAKLSRFQNIPRKVMVNNFIKSLLFIKRPVQSYSFNNYL